MIWVNGSCIMLSSHTSCIMEGGFLAFCLRWLSRIGNKIQITSIHIFLRSTFIPSSNEVVISFSRKHELSGIGFECAYFYTIVTFICRNVNNHDVWQKVGHVIEFKGWPTCTWTQSVGFHWLFRLFKGTSTGQNLSWHDHFVPRKIAVELWWWACVFNQGQTNWEMRLKWAEHPACIMAGVRMKYLA